MTTDKQNLIVHKLWGMIFGSIIMTLFNQSIMAQPSFRSTPPAPPVPSGYGAYFNESSVGSSLMPSEMSASSALPPSGGGENVSDFGSSPTPDTRKNYEKFMYQTFSLLDTNATASNDPNLYNALISFPTDTNTSPVLQIASYGTNAVIIKASHFDYSSENRSFALLVCDTPDAPTWKSIDINSASNSQDGWVIQGAVLPSDVTDPMYFEITNMTNIGVNEYFKAIPYGGPQTLLTGAQPYDTVSNIISLQVTITDLSGVKGEMFTMDVDGLPLRCTVGMSNTINIDTHYNPNGYNNINFNAVDFTAFLYDPNNVPDNTQLSFSATATLTLDFENDTFLAFASDLCPDDAGTNYIYFCLNKDQDVVASISDPTSGQVVASYAGHLSAGYVALPWNLTAADGVTAYSNDTYVVTFTALDPTTITITNALDHNGNIRPGGGCLYSYQYEDPSTPVGSFLNSEADSVIKGDLTTECQYIYSSSDFFQYTTGDIGPNRNTTSCFPYDSSIHPWKSCLGQLTNIIYSELTVAQAHGSGADIGGSKYLPDAFGPLELFNWVLGKGTNHNWRLRKAALWACYSGAMSPLTNGFGSFNPTNTAYGPYFNFMSACGIRHPAVQMNSLMWKNCGLFFQGLLPQGAFGSGGNRCTADAAEALDLLWMCGANQGFANDPNYAFGWAVATTLNEFPEVNGAGGKPSRPVVWGYPWCVYTVNQDFALRNLDHTGVEP